MTDPLQSPRLTFQDSIKNFIPMAFLTGIEISGHKPEIAFYQASASDFRPNLLALSEDL